MTYISDGLSNLQSGVVTGIYQYEPCLNEYMQIVSFIRILANQLIKDLKANTWTQDGSEWGKLQNDDLKVLHLI
jgi:hypothetical protein